MRRDPFERAGRTDVRVLVVLLLAAVVAVATDMTFSTYAPQTADDLPMIQRRQAAAMASLTMGSAAPARVSSTALEASHVLKSSGGTLVGLIGYNSKASAQFIQLYDSATVPADTAVPMMTFTVPASSNFSLAVPLTGVPCTAGIAVSNSSTVATKTIGSADVFYMAIVK